MSSTKQLAGDFLMKEMLYVMMHGDDRVINIKGDHFYFDGREGFAVWNSAALWVADKGLQSFNYLAVPLLF